MLRLAALFGCLMNITAFGPNTLQYVRHSLSADHDPDLPAGQPPAPSVPSARICAL